MTDDGKRIVSEVDEPKEHGNRSDMELAKIKAESEKSRRDSKMDLQKLSVSVRILTVCLFLLIAVYVGDVVMAVNGVSVEASADLFRILTYVLTTTLGAMFVESRKK